MPLSAFGPGKVILLGEHGVVYGHPALAGAISLGVTARAVQSDAPSLDMPEGLTAPQLDALERAFAVAVRRAKYPKVAVELLSELPLSMGLGSSGALSVATARVLLHAARGAAPAVRDVEALALEMEKEFHGTPSGVDHTTSARGGLVLFQKGRAVAVKSARPIGMVVALVGPRASTKLTVGALRDRTKRWPKRYRRLFEHIAVLGREGAAAVRKGGLGALGDIMNVNQGLLASLGLSSPPIEDMVYRLRGLGALGAKLTGAGGDGGAVLGLFEEPSRSAVALRRQGVECFVTELGAD